MAAARRGRGGRFWPISAWPCFRPREFDADPLLNSVDMELVPRATMSSRRRSCRRRTSPPEPIEDAELAIPQPEVMAPDAPPLPVKHKEVQKVVVKHKHLIQQAAKPRAAQQHATPGPPAAMRKPAAISNHLSRAMMSSMRRHSRLRRPLATARRPWCSACIPAALCPLFRPEVRRRPCRAGPGIVSSSRGPSICGADLRQQPFDFH